MLDWSLRLLTKDILKLSWIVPIKPDFRVNLSRNDWEVKLDGTIANKTNAFTKWIWRGKFMFGLSTDKEKGSYIWFVLVHRNHYVLIAMKYTCADHLEEMVTPVNQ